MNLPELASYQQLTPLRLYLQDIARVLGKVQQTFVPSKPHDWQRGLAIDNQTISTCPVPSIQKPIVMNLAIGVVEAGEDSWKLGEISAPDLLHELGSWLQEHGVSKQPEQPEYQSQEPVYDQAQAQAMATALTWTAQQFNTFKQVISKGLTSPVLLYPHHFDVSLTWFPFGDDTQMGFGFSMGDSHIEEPYLYVTAWPEPPEFSATHIARPAYWHSEGFSGFVLCYRDLIAQPDPVHTLRAYATAMHQASSLLKPSS